MSGRLASVLPVLTPVTALGCALVGGVFFAFSTFVMPALARLPAPQGIAAMQSINVTVITPSFMTALFGTGVLCLVLAASVLPAWPSGASLRVLAACALYVCGNVLVTMVFNVPRNDALAALDPTTAEAARFWADFLTGWTAWNHVRTLTALLAAALLWFR